MKKENIIKKSSDFEKMMKLKSRYKNEFLNVYVYKNDLNLDRFGISVPKKTGNAVTRNKIKRRIKDIIDHYPNFTNKEDYLIITKNKIIELSYQELKENLILIINKIIKERSNEKDI